MLCLNHEIQLLTLSHISVILGRRQSWQLHIGHPGTMRQAGKQLHYSSGMAGSAEGEALTPILMRLYAVQWPSVRRRIRQKQSCSYQRAHCLMENPPFLSAIQKKSYLLSPLSISTFKTFWQICCTLCIHISKQQQPHIKLVTAGTTTTAGQLVWEHPAGRAPAVRSSIRLQITES